MFHFPLRRRRQNKASRPSPARCAIAFPIGVVEVVAEILKLASRMTVAAFGRVERSARVFISKTIEGGEAIAFFLNSVDRIIFH